jgi:hypothetical protein
LWSQVLLHAWHRVRDGTGTRADLKAVVINLRAPDCRVLRSKKARKFRQNGPAVASFSA